MKPHTQTGFSPERTPEELVEGLKTLLDVEDLDTDLYRGPRLPGGEGRVFGGQVIAQALVAANRSVDPEFFAHSLHAYFMRPGDEHHPIIFRIERDRDGRSFATRRIIALQQGRPILNMAANFQRFEEGLSHQFDMPEVPAPEELMNERDFWRDHAGEVPEKLVRFVLRARPIELRRTEQRGFGDTGSRPPFDATWFRAVAPLGDDIRLHQAVLAYASDMTLLGTCMRPHGISMLTHPVQTASLDHAIWFHEEFRADDWLLYATDSPWSGHARGYNRGLIFARDGRLVASATQEGLIRLRDR